MNSIRYFPLDVSLRDPRVGQKSFSGSGQVNGEDVGTRLYERLLANLLAIQTLVPCQRYPFHPESLPLSDDIVTEYKKDTEKGNTDPGGDNFYAAAQETTHYFRLFAPETVFPDAFSAQRFSPRVRD
jgi:hypothetical protein